MRVEDELLRMVGRGQGQPGMEEGPPGMPPGMSPEGMPPEAGPPPGPPMDDMPMEPPPGEEMGAEPDLPNTATVMEVQGDTVVLQSDSGQMIKVPIGAFPIPPQQGMQMVQAVVGEVSESHMTALVGPEQTPVDLPIDGMQMPFEQGDYFWMPQPPQTPDMMKSNMVR